MDVVQAVAGYITKMVSAGDGSSASPTAKMKILLLDNETVGLLALSSPAAWRVVDDCVGAHNLHRYDPVGSPESPGVPHRVYSSLFRVLYL